MLGQVERITCKRCGQINARGTGLRAMANPRQAHLCQRCFCDLETGVQDPVAFWSMQAVGLFMTAFAGGAVALVAILLPLELGAGTSGPLRSLLDSPLRPWLAGGVLALGAVAGGTLGWRHVARIRRDLSR